MTIKKRGAPCPKLCVPRRLTAECQSWKVKRIKRPREELANGRRDITQRNTIDNWHLQCFDSFFARKRLPKNAIRQHEAADVQVLHQGLYVHPMKSADDNTNWSWTFGCLYPVYRDLQVSDGNTIKDILTRA